MESNAQSDQSCQEQSHQEGDRTDKDIGGSGVSGDGGGDQPEKLKEGDNSEGPAVNLEEIIKSDIVKYYEDEMRKLVNAINDADSRSISYLSECKSLQGQLSIVVQESENAKQKISELETVVSNYESQMSAMSEHLAALNETLVLQRDQIDELMIGHSNN